MSGYFHQRHQAQSLRKIRFAITTLAGLLICLGAALIYFAYPGTGQAATPNAPVDPAAQPAGGEPSVSMLVTNRRLETGTKIDRTMFSIVQFPAERVPEGAVTEREFDLLSGYYVKDVIHADYPLHRDDLSPQVPFNLLPIPAGFRALSIDADARDLVEGFVVPSSRVDVLWRYPGSSGKERVKTLVPFVKVLSVGSSNRPVEKAALSGGKTTATLLVSAIDAQRIELARARGQITLTLVGGTESSSPLAGTTIDEHELLDDDEIEEEHVNMFEVTDSKNGERVRFCEHGRRFKREACEG